MGKEGWLRVLKGGDRALDGARPELGLRAPTIAPFLPPHHLLVQSWAWGFEGASRLPHPGWLGFLISKSFPFPSREASGPPDGLQPRQVSSSRPGAVTAGSGDRSRALGSWPQEDGLPGAGAPSGSQPLLGAELDKTDTWGGTWGGVLAGPSLRAGTRLQG